MGGDINMATNGPKGKGRKGSVVGRKQYHNPKTNLWVKVKTATGKFIDDKTTGGVFKGIRRG